MLPLPKEFDGNEWFLLITLLLGSTLIFLPKKFPTSLTIIIIIFTSFMSRTLDHLLASPKWDLYDIMDTGKYELIGILSYFFYAPFGYLFIYIYDKFQFKGFFTFIYIIISSFLATGIEWIASLFDVFNYKEWKIYYSFTVYLIVQSITIVVFQYLKKVYHFSLRDKV